MTRLCFIFGVLGFILKVSGTANKYENYTLMKIFPQTEDKNLDIMNFLNSEVEMEIMKTSRGVNDSMDVLFPEHRMEFIRKFVFTNNITYEKQENYGRTFEEVKEDLRRTINMPFDYYSAKAMQEYITNIARSHPDLVKLIVRGQSFQGWDITLVRISADPNAYNPVIFVDAGIHAREWLAPAMALYLIHRLTTDPKARTNELKGVDWFILPLVNPDGYEYSRSNANNRLWRKTRSKHPGPCYGVDGNRNYDFKWGVSGSSKSCYTDTFQGPKPFSESETRVVRDILKESSHRIKVYVSLHAYGHHIVYPWGYSNELPREWLRMDMLAKKVSAAVERAGGKPFKVGSAGRWYPAAGGSDDYAFGVLHVPYSYTMELSDGYEFNFPKSQLAKALPLYYEGFKEFAKHIKTEFRSYLSNDRNRKN